MTCVSPWLVEFFKYSNLYLLCPCSFYFFIFLVSVCLQATHFVDSEAEDTADALQALGGAKIILGTAINAKAMEACIGGMFVLV